MDILKIVITVLAIFSSYYIGMKVYFKQKEYELVKKRYLDECLDLLCANADHMLSVFRANWSQSLWICQLFREAGKNLGEDYYNKKFQELDHTLFTLTPFFKLRHIIDDQIFYEATQLLVAFVEKTTSFFENDLMVAIKMYITEELIDEDHKIIARNYTEKITEFYNESYKFYDLISGLLVLDTVLEKEKFSFKGLDKFKENEAVVKTITKMKEVFPGNKKTK